MRLNKTEGRKSRGGEQRSKTVKGFKAREKLSIVYRQGVVVAAAATRICYHHRAGTHHYRPKIVAAIGHGESTFSFTFQSFYRACLPWIVAANLHVGCSWFAD